MTQKKFSLFFYGYGEVFPGLYQDKMKDVQMVFVAGIAGYFQEGIDNALQATII